MTTVLKINHIVLNHYANEALDSLWTEGCAMTMEQAIKFALGMANE